MPITVSVDVVRCPGCGQAMQRVVDGGVRYSCPGCRGRLVGLSPFVRDHPGDGRRLWLASEAGADADATCPFCAGRLRTPAVENPPPGLAVCRRCEQVWVPAEAAAALPAGASPPTDAAAPTAKAHPDECPECGAPWAPDAGGRCRYCREQLTADQPVVIIERLGASW